MTTPTEPRTEAICQVDGCFQPHRWFTNPGLYLCDKHSRQVLASQPEPAVTEALRELAVAYNDEREYDPTEETSVLLGRCLAALGLTLAAVPAPSPAPEEAALPTKCPLCGGPHLSATTHSYEELRDYEQRIEERKRAAARVDACRAHDRNGPTDEDSGFPTCSRCGAILAEARAASPSPAVDRLRCGKCGDDLLPSEVEGHLNSEGRTSSPAVAPPLDVDRLAKVIHEKITLPGHAYPGAPWNDACDEVATQIVDEYARLTTEGEKP